MVLLVNRERYLLSLLVLLIVTFSPGRLPSAVDSVPLSAYRLTAPLPGASEQAALPHSFAAATAAPSHGPTNMKVTLLTLTALAAVAAASAAEHGGTDLGASHRALGRRLDARNNNDSDEHSLEPRSAKSKAKAKAAARAKAKAKVAAAAKKKAASTAKAKAAA